MTSEVKIALAQHDTVHGNVDANLEKICEYIAHAGEESADLVVFPELATTGYRQDLLGDKLNELAETPQGKSAKTIGEAAKKAKTNVICGFIEQGPMRGVPYNSSLIINRQGEVMGTYRKNHYFGTESYYFSQGETLPVFDMDFGRVGVMICYDMGLPEVARILTLKGADIIAVPSAWQAPDEDIWDINIPCRALENRIFLAATNRVGEEGELDDPAYFKMMGKSKVAGPRGETRVEAKRFEEDLVFATVDLNELVVARQEIPYLRSRKPESYKKLVELDLSEKAK